MKLIVNGTEYACTGKPSLREPVRFCLPDGQPDPEALGGVISLRDDGGTVLREITAGDFSRWYIDGTSLVGTNTPEPEPVEPEEPGMTVEEAMMDLLTDVDYRLSLVELGLTGGETTT